MEARERKDRVNYIVYSIVLADYVRIVFPLASLACCGNNKSGLVVTTFQ